MIVYPEVCLHKLWRSQSEPLDMILAIIRAKHVPPHLIQADILKLVGLEDFEEFEFPVADILDVMALRMTR